MRMDDNLQNTWYANDQKSSTIGISSGYGKHIVVLTSDQIIRQLKVSFIIVQNF